MAVMEAGAGIEDADFAKAVEMAVTNGRGYPDGLPKSFEYSPFMADGTWDTSALRAYLGTMDLTRKERARGDRIVFLDNLPDGPTASKDPLAMHMWGALDSRYRNRMIVAFATDPMGGRIDGYKGCFARSTIRQY